MMQDINWLFVWLVGFVITGIAMIGKGSKKGYNVWTWVGDIFASFLVGAIWFIYIPVMIVWKVIR